MKLVEPLSPRAYELAEEYQLGMPKEGFCHETKRDRWGSIIAALSVGAVLLTFSIGFSLLLASLTTPENMQQSLIYLDTPLTCMKIIAALFLIGGFVDIVL